MTPRRTIRVFLVSLVAITFATWKPAPSSRPTLADQTCITSVNGSSTHFVPVPCPQ